MQSEHVCTHLMSYLANYCATVEKENRCIINYNTLTKITRKKIKLHVQRTKMPFMLLLQAQK